MGGEGAGRGGEAVGLEGEEGRVCLKRGVLEGEEGRVGLKRGVGLEGVEGGVGLKGGEGRRVRMSECLCLQWLLSFDWT